MKTVFRVFLIAGLGVGFVSCGDRSVPLGQAQAAVPECAAAGMTLAKSYGANPQLTASFAVSALQMAAWQESARQSGGPQLVRSPWRDRPATDSVAVCYFDGTFDKLGAQPAALSPASNPVAFTRLAIVVNGGKAQLLGAGTPTSVPASDPSKP